MAVSMEARRMKASGVDVVDLSLGEPDFETPGHLLKAAAAAMHRGETRYTAADGTPELKDAIVEKFARENGLAFERHEISAANGAKQSIFNALMATLEPGDEVVVTAPYWISYTDMVLLLGGKPKVLSCSVAENFKVTPEKLDAAITSRTRWVMFNAPNNPSGAIYSLSELVALGEVLERYPHVLVMSDEIYEHIRYTASPFPSFLAACPNLRERLLIVNGVSKTYAMTGWRIGYAAGPRGLIATMGKIQSQSTSNPCSISQAAAIAALRGPQDFVSAAVAEYGARKNLVIAGINSIEGLTVRDPDGAFYAFPECISFVGRRTPTGKQIASGTDLVSYLLEEAHVAAVPGAAFGLEPYFRISFATSRDQLARALENMRSALARLI
jgi:aspartate aminotransferase